MRLRAALLAVLVVAINCMSTFAQAATILDTLGDFTTSDVVPLPGSFGQGVAETPQIGPLFILSVPTRITEIGAFLDSCASHLPGCEPDALFVDIHRSFFGVPDLSSVLGTFALPLDHDPLTTTYLSVDPQAGYTPPGDYFALFRALEGGNGDNFLLGGIGNPDYGNFFADEWILGEAIEGGSLRCRVEGRDAHPWRTGTCSRTSLAPSRHLGPCLRSVGASKAALAVETLAPEAGRRACN